MEEEGINAFIYSILLYRWRKEYCEGKFKVDKRKKKVLIERRKVTEIVRIQQLERENQRHRIENELLKKSDRVQHRDKADIFRLIDRYKNLYGENADKKVNIY